LDLSYVAYLRVTRESYDLPSTSVYYSFSQSFRVPPDKAFEWCTDYEASDVELMRERGKRKVTKLAEDAFILIDSFTTSDGRKVSKTRLVRLCPKDLFWTSTTIAGSNKYSQFLYRIIPEGRNRSRLEFTGLHLETRKISKSRTKELARKRKLAVSTSWKHLAREMERANDFA